LSGSEPAASADAALFPGFRAERIRTRETEIHAVIGGQGPPVLLLHGYPETHACWHRVAPALAERFTVVCPDLRGYGDSGRPAADPAHRAYSKRVMAEDQRETMAQLGFERFAVVGHDRGGRVAYRLALDHPERVTRLAVIDIVPTLETWARLDRQAGLDTYHWYFLAQPHDLPERLIGADPDYFLEWTLESWAGRRQAFDARALAEYRRAFRDPQVIRATCEDYRAGATVDVEADNADRGHRRIACPVLALWAGAHQAAESPWDPLEIWRGWARDVEGQPIPGGHFLPEESPEGVLAALRPFLAR
jgi:haloacetate dehalogenase